MRVLITVIRLRKHSNIFRTLKQPRFLSLIKETLKSFPRFLKIFLGFVFRFIMRHFGRTREWANFQAQETEIHRLIQQLHMKIKPLKLNIWSLILL